MMSHRGKMNNKQWDRKAKEVKKMCSNLFISGLEKIF